MLRIGVIMYQTSLTKGQELVAQRMVREFRRQGQEAFLITSKYHDGQPVGAVGDAADNGGYTQTYDKDLDLPIIRLSGSSTSWPPRRIQFDNFVGVLKRIVDEFDLNVLITHSTLWNGPEDVLKFVRWTRRMVEDGAPYGPLLFCHMSHFQEPSDERYAIEERSYRETWNSTILRPVLEEADLILTVADNESEYMKKNLGAREEKIFSFPGGIDSETTVSRERPGDFRARHGLDSETKLISYLGTVEERKNALGVLGVADELTARQDIHFVVAGTLQGEYGEVVRDRASRMRNVSVTGPLSEADKADLIRSSYLNISMSRSEALGLAQLEFMSMGVPVISSGVGGQAWVVRNGSNGIVVNGPDDVKGAAEAVLKLVDRPSLREKMSRNASGFASNFSMERLVRLLSRRLEAEIRNNGRGRGPEGPLLEKGEEQLLEAWAHGGERVAATSKRLIIRSAKGGKEMIAIPYNQISRIVHHIRAPWPLLVVGISATAVLVSQRMLGLGIISRLLGPGISNVLSSLGHPELSAAVVGLLPLAPGLISAAIFSVLITDGFMVYYGSSSKAVFVPKRFVKALRVADKLTPDTDLFVDE